MTDLRTTSLADLAADVATRRISARELVDRSLRDADRWAGLNAWVVVDGDRALAEAAALDEAIARGEQAGPLAGVPIGVKDLDDAAGFRTAYGSLLHAADPPAATDSVLTARLRAAGAIVIGKTTTPEHGYTGDTVSPLTGVSRNPYDPERSPGGSSGGSAAALAAGVVPLATGSDGGGSIRGPGSICGLCALKPSAGRVPMGGARAPGAGVLAVRAPMARTARDTAYALAVAAGPHGSDPFSLPAPPPGVWHLAAEPPLPRRVVWCASPGGFPVDTAVREAYDRAVRHLEAAGTEVVVVDELHEQPPVADWWTLWTAYRNRGQGHLRGTPAWEQIDPGLRALMDHAEASVTPTGLLRAFDACHRVNLEVEAALAQGEVVLTPAVAGQTARCGGQGTVDGEETPLWFPYTQAYNMSRHPVGVVPCGTLPGGLPVGMQVAGRHGDDWGVLAAMAALEALWSDLTPPPPEPVG
ncbi:MAG TPA: amidase [Acidimicrobiales bacterium]|nr:amidase [Acidimicrobiales bacterium]